MRKKEIKILFEPSLAFCENRLRYVLDFLQHHSLSNGNVVFKTQGKADISIRYHHQNDSDEHGFFIPAQRVFFSEQGKSPHESCANVYSHDGTDVFSVEIKPKATVPFFDDGVFAFDVLESIFFHISRYEEWFCEEEGKDQWDMMKTQTQFLVRHGIHQIPVVDRLVFAFLQALGLQPPRKPTVFSISHDIDEVRNFSSIWKPFRRSAGLLLRKRNWWSHGRLWQAYAESVLGKERDPFDVFDWMIHPGKLQEKTIYFLVGGNTRYDTPYDLQSKRMQEIFALCLEQGYRIGIHPSYATWRDEDLFRKEKSLLEQVINRPVKISRQHYLHFDFSQTPKILQGQGITQDSSLGYNECIGFRCGTGFPYRLYNFEEEAAFDFLEDPLVLMDSALFWETNYHPERIQALWESFLNNNSHATRINFNFHNSRFFDAWLHQIPLQEMYKQILARQ